MAVNVRELVLDTLLAQERGEGYSHRLVKSMLDQHGDMDPRDRAFVKRVAEGTLERQLELDYYLDSRSSLPVRKMRPFVRCLLRMSAYQLLYMDAVPDSAVCNEACKLAEKRGFRNLKGFVNGLLRTLSREKEALPLPDRQKEPLRHLSVKYSMPEWLVRLWADEYGWEIAERLLGGLLEEHPVSLRFSTALTGEERETLCGRIREQGADLTVHPYLPWVYRLKAVDGVDALPGFREGKCIVQDISSVLAVAAAGIGEEDFVIDVCAAPGGKSILAAEKARRGRVLARDVTEEKAALVRENIRRMGAGNIEVQIFDGMRTDAGLAGRADVVLLDVPCSGLGVIGKKRDIKYRMTPEKMDNLAKLQKEIVRSSAPYVKPGGILLYSTCTIHGGENQAMARFLARELGFAPLPLEGRLPEAVFAGKRKIAEDLCKAGKDPALGLTEEEDSACIQLLPGYMESDGFFLAAFRRKE